VTWQERKSTYYVSCSCLRRTAHHARTNLSAYSCELATVCHGMPAWTAQPTSAFSTESANFVVLSGSSASDITLCNWRRPRSAEWLHWEVARGFVQWRNEGGAESISPTLPRNQLGMLVVFRKFHFSALSAVKEHLKIS